MLVTQNTVEIRVKGRWVTVPVVEVSGKKLIAKGTWLRTATIRSEEMMENELEDPRLCIRELKTDGNRVLKADIFTFPQKMTATQPKYSYPIEWDSVAVAQVNSFKDWWDRLPQETRKNVRRSQKRGVVITVNEFDDDLD